MKRIWIALTAAALVAALCATGALAGWHGRGLRYTDTDGDGVCDNHGPACGRYFTDADGDGICDNYGTGLGGHHGRGACRNQ